MLDSDFRKKISADIKETNKQVLSQSFGLISSAFILIAALAWNDTVKALIDLYLPQGQGLISKLIYTVVVTILAVIITSKLNKITLPLRREK